MSGIDKWNWFTEEIKRVGYRVVDLIADYLTALPEGPAFRPCPPDLIDRLSHAAVFQGSSCWRGTRRLSYAARWLSRFVASGGPV
jgi:hypothetical protein